MQVAWYRSPKTVVSPNGITGRGPYVSAPIARGEVVSVMDCHLVDRAALVRHRAVVNDADMQVTANLFLAPLAADEFEGVMMFLKHSYEPNVDRLSQGAEPSAIQHPAHQAGRPSGTVMPGNRSRRTGGRRTRTGSTGTRISSFSRSISRAGIRILPCPLAPV